jgi:hypothetical protein
MEAARREPIAEPGARTLRPRPDFLDRDLAVRRELVGREADLSGAAEHVVHEDDLVEPFERIRADERPAQRVDAELLDDFSDHRLLGRLAGFQESRDEAVPRRRPAEAPHEDDAPRALHDRGDHRHRVAPLHKIAGGAGEAFAAAVRARHERRPAHRAVLEFELRH